MMLKEMPLSFEISNTVPHMYSNALISVQKSLIPIYILNDIRVQCERAEELTILKRIILESALELGVIEPSDIEEITGLPAHVAKRQLTILERVHLFETNDHSIYIPIRDMVIRALESHAYPVRYQRNLPFIYLPETDDLLAVDAKQRGLFFRDILKKSYCKYPFPPFPNDTLDLNAFVDKKIKEADIGNLPKDVIGVYNTQKEKKFPADCPAYLCSGTVEEMDGGRIVTIEIMDKNEFDQTYQIVLQGAIKLLSKWNTVMQLIGEPHCQNQIWGKLGLECDTEKKIAQVNSTIDIELNNEDLRHIMENQTIADRTLAEPFGLLVTAEDNTIFEFRAQFSPADEEAQKEFAFSEIIRDIQRLKLTALNRSTVRSICNEVSQKYAMDDTTADALDVIINERLWFQKRYNITYRLRECEDFTYE